MRRWLGVVTLLLSVQPLTVWRAEAAPVTWVKEAGGNGHVYEAVYVAGGLNWVQAQLAAAARGCGWYLATITSVAENKFVFGLIRNKPKFFVEGFNGPWLGGFQASSRSEPKGDWRWVTSESFSYTNWVVGQPNDYVAGDSIMEPGVPTGQQEGFLHYIFKAGQWNDLNVNAQPVGFIAEFDTVRQKVCRAKS
jgi:hypothetical protein